MWERTSTQRLHSDHLLSTGIDIEMQRSSPWQCCKHVGFIQQRLYQFWETVKPWWPTQNTWRRKLTQHARFSKRPQIKIAWGLWTKWKSGSASVTSESNHMIIAIKPPDRRLAAIVTTAVSASVRRKCHWGSAASIVWYSKCWSEASHGRWRLRHRVASDSQHPMKPKKCNRNIIYQAEILVHAQYGALMTVNKLVQWSSDFFQ